ncbi:MAG: arginase [Halobacteriovoraceae bacterium]|nr:arginase [Halobacteriovoraceae bacterium]
MKINIKQKDQCSLITAATHMGQKKPGTELAGDWLKVRGLSEKISEFFSDFRDIGNVFESIKHEKEYELSDELSITKKLKKLSHYSERLSEVIFRELSQDRFVLTIGGDHSIAAGTLAASLQFDENIKVLWVDAHADLNTPRTSPSHNTHGMPVAIAMDLVNEVSENNLFSFLPKLKPQNIAYIGLRDVDPGERAFLDRFNIKSYDAQDVHRLGIEQVLTECKQYLDPDSTNNIHLSFDVDAIDPLYFPATGTPVPEGLSLKDGRRIIEFLNSETNLISFDLVEINPLLGGKEELDQTFASTMELLSALKRTRKYPTGSIHLEENSV